MPKRIHTVVLLLTGLVAILSLMQPVMAAPAKQPPNILLIITDDTGIDQFTAYGYGGTTEAEKVKTPNVDALAKAGVRFSNAWSHPSCGPTRASIMSGRYTPRFNMLSAPVPPDLPNSQASPYEFTIGEVLHKKRNYINAAIGKMHQSNYFANEAQKAYLPFLNETMRRLGFDYFEGYLEGGPAAIDTTAGGVGSEGTYGCGFVPSLKENSKIGADFGSCYLSDPTPDCMWMSTSTVPSPGRACMEKGGIFVPNEKNCPDTKTPPIPLNFAKQNGHYTGNWVINKPDGTTETQPVADSRGRGFKTQQEVNRAIAWIKQQKGDQPWLLSLGLSAIHEPVHQSPRSLVAADAVDTGGYNCSDNTQNRELATQMVEAIDHEVGRLLVETGLATYGSRGELIYKPNETNTWVIFTSDNGTWSTSVKEPFDPTRAKGTTYQTGVSVPLIITGPGVKSPDREVDHMVNLTDLFSFFGEVAKVNVRQAVPRYRDLDAQKMLAYLTNPKQGAIRKTNYTVQGNNIRPSGTVSYPCVLPEMNQCTYSLPAKSVCEDQNGKWYGPEGEVNPAYTSCCQITKPAEDGTPTDETYLSVITTTGIRDKNFKLVRQSVENCQNGAAVSPPKLIDELYQINQDSPEQLKLDTADLELMKGDPKNLNTVQRRHYKELSQRLKRLETSFVSCPGDGNMDKVVDQKDLDEWAKFTASATPPTENGGGLGSWYDFGGPSDATRPDGITDEVDRQIIEANLGKRCK